MKGAVAGACPFPVLNLTKVNHNGAPTENPYKTRLGQRWRKDIINNTVLSSIVCVTDLVEYTMREAKRVMAGTKHKGDWYFYHVALLLMTTKEIRRW